MANFNFRDKENDDIAETVEKYLNKMNDSVLTSSDTESMVQQQDAYKSM